MMLQPEIRLLARQYFLEKDEAPAQLLQKKQRDCLEYIGVERDFGVECLNQIPRTFPGDQALFQKLQSLEMSASKIVQEAKLSDEELEVRKQEEIRQAHEAIRAQEQQRQRMAEIQLAVDSMAQEERQALKAKMLPRWKTLMRLPQQERVKYLSRQAPSDQVDFSMMSLLLVKEANEQQESPQSYMQRLVAE